MATTSYSSVLDSKHPITGYSNLRTSVRHGEPPRPNSPHTSHPGIASLSRADSTLGSSFRSDEEAIIFELGSRCLRAGFAGNSAPMCTVRFGPRECRRAGDYRDWLRSSTHAERSNPRAVDPDVWTRPYELWRMDLREIDLGLVEDEIERTFREIFNKYLLTDAGSSRLVLVLPSLVPHPLLASVLSTLFSRWRFPSITLLPAAAMATVAAGLRAALVVDLGWAETTVTGVYEYREITSRRSTRAMRSLMQEMGKILGRFAFKDDGREPGAEDGILVDFEFCEDVVSRFAWCRQHGYRGNTPTNGQETSDQAGAASIADRMVSIPSLLNSAANYIEVPFSTFSDPVENVIFGRGLAENELDDHEKSIPLLLYSTLLALPPDVRGSCMSRIVFTGGGANIPGTRQRICQELAVLVERHGWSQARGRIIDEQRQKLKQLRTANPGCQTQAEHDEENITSETTTRVQPNAPEADEIDLPQNDQKRQETRAQDELDYVEQKLRRMNRDNDAKPDFHGILREVESLGPWSGASLVTSLKIRGLVEIEREKFLQQGLSGASRDWDFHSSHAHSHAAGDRRSGLRAGGDRSSWTLAGWG